MASSGLRDATCFILDKAVGKIPIIGDILTLGSGYICSRMAANEQYDKLVPVTKSVIQLQGRESDNAKAMLDQLLDLAPPGIRTLNFKQFYINKPDGWKALPDSHKDLPYAVWDSQGL